MLTTILVFIIVLGLLVFVHELGHYLAAKACGMKVYEFAIGFPPRAFGWYKDPKTGKRVFFLGKGKSLKDVVAGNDVGESAPTTVYSVNWLPLGGFVRIKGENGENANDPDSFGFQKWWKRLIVLVAGVAMNIALAAVLLGVGFTVGLPASADIEDKHAIFIGEPQVLIQQVEEDSPAHDAGLQFGDIIVSADGTNYTSDEALIEYIRATDNAITFTIQRGEERFDTTLSPRFLENMEDHRRIGVILADATIIRYPWYIAMWKGIVAAFSGLVTIFVSFYLLIKNLILGNGLLFEVAGPVGIAQVVGQSARLGISYLVNVTAMISLSLAAINILPIPALDGGRVLFVLIESIIRKRVPMKYEQVAHTFGFVALMILIIVVTWRDIVRIF